MEDEIAIIAAVAKNRVIGCQTGLPWRIPEDLRRFRTLTTGHSVIMGRKTWDLLPHALEDRQNIVLTSDLIDRSGAQTALSLRDAIKLANLPRPVFVIGGASVYGPALEIASTLFMTEIAKDFDGDVLFPPINPVDWHEKCRITGTQDGLIFDFVEYWRIRKDWKRE